MHLRQLLPTCLFPACVPGHQSRHQSSVHPSNLQLLPRCVRSLCYGDCLSHHVGYGQLWTSSKEPQHRVPIQRRRGTILPQVAKRHPIAPHLRRQLQISRHQTRASSSTLEPHHCLIRPPSCGVSRCCPQGPFQLYGPWIWAHRWRSHVQPVLHHQRVPHHRVPHHQDQPLSRVQHHGVPHQSD